MSMPLNQESIEITTRAIERFFNAIAPAMKEMNRTVLLGWPFDESPTEAECRAIEATAAEIGMHEPQLGESRCWYMAGQIVARMRRDGVTVTA